MNDCRIKRILDSIDTEILRTLMSSGKWVYIGIPEEIIKLYLKEKEDAKKEKTNIKGTD